jgi:hypothetical protein
MIKSLEDLTAFLKICRKQGVTDIKFEGFSVVFGEAPKKPREKDETDQDEIPTDGLTPEQLAFYSVAHIGDQ